MYHEKDFDDAILSLSAFALEMLQILCQQGREIPETHGVILPVCVIVTF